MSPENVEVVRSYVTFYEGEDVAAVVRRGLADVDLEDADAISAAVATFAAEDPACRVHPDIV